MLMKWRMPFVTAQQRTNCWISLCLTLHGHRLQNDLDLPMNPLMLLMSEKRLNFSFGALLKSFYRISFGFLILGFKCRNPKDTNCYISKTIEIFFYRNGPEWNWPVTEKHNDAAEVILGSLEVDFRGFSLWKFPSYVIRNRTSAFLGDLIHFSTPALTQLGMVRQIM